MQHGTCTYSTVSLHYEYGKSATAHICMPERKEGSYLEQIGRKEEHAKSSSPTKENEKKYQQNIYLYASFVSSYILKCTHYCVQT